MRPRYRPLTSLTTEHSSTSASRIVSSGVSLTDIIVFLTALLTSPISLSAFTTSFFTSTIVDSQASAVASRRYTALFTSSSALASNVAACIKTSSYLALSKSRRLPWHPPAPKLLKRT
ncbi:hypothetical protein TRVL_09861 [Trypanosoma vivax]|nr:hypothetical protein TRVL_09861 [Trypanosoma vivax]